MSLKSVPAGEDAPNVINLVIEIQRGSRNKYETDDNGNFFLDRVTPISLGYPTDYGFIPQTLSEDNDPLDGLLVIDESVPQGAIVPARPVGVLYMVDDGEKDEKLICVADKDITKSHIKEVDDLGADFKKIIEHFLNHYKDWKNDWQGVDVSFDGWGDSQAAKQVVTESVERFKNK